MKEKRRSAEMRYDSRWAPIYDENWGAVIEPSHQKFLAKFLNACPPHCHILDVACGTGKYWRTILDNGHTVFGIDQSQEMLNRAHEKFPDVQIEKIGMQEMRFQEIFDAAICMDAMENVFPEDWTLVLENTHRAIKPNGYFYFTVESASDSELEKAFNAAQQTGLPVVDGEWVEEEGYHYYPKPEQVREWVQQVGFKLIEESFQDLYWHFLVYKP